MKQKKLTLKKKTVSNLNVDAMESVKGGVLFTDRLVCDTVHSVCLEPSCPVICDPNGYTF